MNANVDLRKQRGWGRPGGLQTAKIPGHMSKAGAKGGVRGGRVQGLVNAASGELDFARHVRWHLIQGKTPKVYCKFCRKGRRGHRWRGNRLVRK